MAREYGPIRVIVAAALAGCSGPGWRDLSEPPTPDDLTSLPAKVTSENARAVVRKALQRHAGAESNALRSVGYAFRRHGFVQLRTERQADDRRDRHARTYVNYGSLEAPASEVVVDTALLRRRVRVVLTGGLRRWETWVVPTEPAPPLGSEPSRTPVDRLLLDFDDADAASRLVEALRLLSGDRKE